MFKLQQEVIRSCRQLGFLMASLRDGSVGWLQNEGFVGVRVVTHHPEHHCCFWLLSSWDNSLEGHLEAALFQHTLLSHFPLGILLPPTQRHFWLQPGSCFLLPVSRGRHLPKGFTLGGFPCYVFSLTVFMVQTAAFS